MEIAISIIVPVYNVQSFLSRCVDSILKQSFSNWELLLIDDGSTDDSGLICDTYAKNDERIKVIHKENGGVSTARNVGLEEARGEWITFIDSDDYVLNFYLSDLYDAVLKESCDIVVSGNKRITEENVKDYTFDEDVLTRKEFDRLLLKHNLQKHGSPWAKLYRMSIIRENNLSFNPDISLGEDIIFLFNFLLHSRSVVFLSVANYCYVYREGSLTLRLNDYESEWKGCQEFLCIGQEMRKSLLSDEAYFRLNNNTIFMERVINAIYKSRYNRTERIYRLKRLDISLYKKCKTVHTWKEWVLKKLLTTKLWAMYDFIMKMYTNEE